MKNIFKFLTITSMLLTSLLITGCQNENNNHMVIYTTNYATKYLLNTIGGDYVSAYSVYDNTDEFNHEEEFEYQFTNIEEFTFAANPEKTEKVLEADAFIYNSYSKTDLTIVNELLELDKDENVLFIDIRDNMNVNDVNPILSLAYDEKVVSNSLQEILYSSNDIEAFWISPSEMKNASYVVYDFLVDQMPNYKSEFNTRLDSLVYNLNSLYSEIETINSNTLNNVIFSDSTDLNTYYGNGIINGSTNYLDLDLFKDDEDATAYNEAISEHLTINSSKVILTSDPSSTMYFDLFVVRTKSDYDNGNEYIQIMKRNFEVIRRALQ